MSDQELPAPQSLRIGDVEISGVEQTPLVLLLLSVIQQLKKENQDLRDEIQRLKGTTRRPDIKPSVLLKPPKPPPTKPPGKRPGSTKRDKTKDLRIDQDHVLQPSDLPPGAVLEGYRDFVVQDPIFKSNNTRYRRAVYRLPEGTLRVAQRPDDVNSHFGLGLRQNILLQVHQNHVTQNRLLELLRDTGIDILAGQISNILLAGHDAFHNERKIDRLIPLTVAHRRAKEQSQTKFWELYASLKAYRESPTEQQSVEIGSRFDTMYEQRKPSERSSWQRWIIRNFRCITICRRTTFASMPVFARSVAGLAATWVDVAVTRS